MALVFVSHAAADKKRLRPLLEALLDYGHKLFIDRPADIGFDRAFVRRWNIREIDLADEWSESLDRWLAAADVVLGCFSLRMAEAGPVLERELSYAVRERKLVSCLIDDVDFDDLPEQILGVRLGDLQLRKLDLPALARARPKAPAEQSEAEEAAVEDARLIAAAVKKRAASVQFRSSERRADAQAAFDPSSLSFVDRRPQKVAFQNVMVARPNASGVTLMLLAGPENECLDQFIDRITGYPELSAGPTPHLVRPSWPMDLPPSAFDEEFLDCLAEALRLAPPADHAAVAEALCLLPQPILCVCDALLTEWRPEDLERLQRLDAFWRRVLDAAPSALRVIATLSTVMDRAEPGWQSREVPPDSLSATERLLDRLGWARRCSNRRFVSVAKALGPDGAPQVGALTAEVDFVELLQPIQQRHVNEWLAEYAPGSGVGVKRAFSELFATPKAKRWGVSMEAFLEKAEEVFAERSGARREGE